MTELTDATIVALVPALVELGKRGGLPNRFAGLAALVIAVTLEVLRAYATGSVAGARMATPLVNGLVIGLAACGLYSQARRLDLPTRKPAG